MQTIYVVSPEPNTGKGWIGLMLVWKFIQSGWKTAYFRPLGTLPVKIGELIADEDTVYVNQSLDLGIDKNILTDLLILNDELIEKYLTETNVPDYVTRFVNLNQKLKQNTQITVLGGAGSLFSTGSTINLSVTRVRELFQAQVFLVVKYSNYMLDAIIAAKTMLKENLTGVIFNAIPADKIELTRTKIVPYLENKSIPVLGTIPYDSILSSVSVSELQTALNAELLCCQEKTEGLVEHFCIGAMNPESALKHFRQVPNKTVITGGDRMDIQLAALETSTTCIILTGNLRPTPTIVGKAELLGVPLLLVKEDTLSVVEKIETILGKLPVRGEKKIQRARELFNQYFDFTRLCKLMNIA